MLLDERRSCDAVAGEKRVAAVGRRGVALAAEPGVALSGGGRTRGRARAPGDALKLRFLHHAGDRSAQAHDLRALLRGVGAIAPQVLVVEVALEPLAVA